MLKNLRALFLDRDGVINIDYSYLSIMKKFDFIDDILIYAELI
jgi:histidinol phosphatase-like enzyme